MPFSVTSTTVITDDRLIRLSSGGTVSRPASPVAGTLFYNTGTGKVEVYNGSTWKEAISTAGTEIPSAWSWGNGATYGQLGDNTLSNRSSPVSVVGGFTDWTQLSAARSQSFNKHSLGIRANGTAWAWGSNAFGQLGDNTLSNRSSPVSVVGGFTDWKQVSAGGTHSLGLRDNGTAWAWGGGGGGTLGDNTATGKSSPVSVVGGFTDWVDISAGYDHSLAVRANGTAWAWGSGTTGRLGTGNISARSSPVSIVGGITWRRVSAGNGMGAGVSTSGVAWTWGNGGNGRLGDNTAVSKSSPVSVVGGFTDWMQISAALNNHSAGVRANGSAWSWGGAANGRLGNNTVTPSVSSPVSVVGGFTDWVSVEVGFSHSLALRANGTAWGWGLAANTSSAGYLGTGNLTARSSPVSIAGGFTDWVQVSTGYMHALALRSQPRVLPPSIVNG